MIYTADPSAWKEHLGPVGSLKSFITADTNTKTQPAPYVTVEDKAYHHEMFGDDYSAPTCWYKRSLANLGVEEERKTAERGEIKTSLDRETLMVTGLSDAVCLPAMARQVMEGDTEEGKLTIVEVDAGHVSKAV